VPSGPGNVPFPSPGERTAPLTRRDPGGPRHR
jgi:hypothetical protein